MGTLIKHLKGIEQKPGRSKQYVSQPMLSCTEYEGMVIIQCIKGFD